MIPKSLHYGAFGGHKLSELNEQCLSSWRQKLPDYSIRFWTDADLPDVRFLREAIKSTPVNVHSYMRFHVLEKFGGVFLDNDVEVFRPFDLNCAAFLGFQRQDIEDACIGDAVMGCVAHHPIVKWCLKKLDKAEGNTWPVWCSCGILTEWMRRHGMHGLNVPQRVGDVVVYGRESFYPWGFDAPKDMALVTKKTVAAHHCEGSWRR